MSGCGGAGCFLTTRSAASAASAARPAPSARAAARNAAAHASSETRRGPSGALLAAPSLMRASAAAARPFLGGAGGSTAGARGRSTGTMTGCGSGRNQNNGFRRFFGRRSSCRASSFFTTHLSHATSEWQRPCAGMPKFAGRGCHGATPQRQKRHSVLCRSPFDANGATVTEWSACCSARIQ